jgi:hypothetical protein
MSYSWKGDTMSMSQRSVIDQIHGIIMVHFRDRREFLAGSSQSFHDLNADEGDFLQIIAEIESAFSIKVDVVDLQKQATSHHFLFLTAEVIGEYIWKIVSTK